MISLLVLNEESKTHINGNIHITMINSMTAYLRMNLIIFPKEKV